MTRLPLAALLAGSFALSSPASAEEGRKIKLAVLDVRASGPVVLKSIEGLTFLIASELSRDRELSVLSGGDLRAMIGFEKDRSLFHCTDSCLAEIGGALGVDYILSSEVSQVGEIWLLSMSLVDIKRAIPVIKVTRKGVQPGDLVAQAEPAAAAVGGAIPRYSAPRSQVPSWVMIGTGVASAAAGTYLVFSARSVEAAYNAGQDVDVKPTVTRSEARDAERNATIGVGAIAAGAALGLASWLFWPPPPQDDPHAWGR